MLEIHPYKGIFRNLAVGDLHALLQISVAFTFGDNKYYIVTPVAQGTEYANGFGYYQTANFIDHYYINIDDDTIRQSNTITMHLQMWHVRRHRGLSDVEIIDGDDDYSIGTPSETYTTIFANQTGYFGHLNELEVKVKTVAIEKANTFAIFNANTTFNGHYNDPHQRYTLIQLNIPDEGHYLGSESFINEEIGTNSTNIDFISSDSSDVESYTQIIEDIDGHSNVLRVQEGVDDHSDFDHNFGSSKNAGTLEWWWRTSKISGGISYFYLKNGNTDVIRLFMRDGKIKYHNGSYHDVMTAISNTWYRMKLVFACKIGAVDVHSFDLYVDGVLKVSEGTFYSNEDSINKLRITTMGDPFYSYFDAFGYSWDSNYDVGDNNQHYSVEGTPFEHGMNVIVVPTELFTHTKLNGYVENDNLDQTPLYHPDEHMFEFTAISRDGNPDKANSDVDFLFTRYGISPEDAMDVLDLILWGCVNETLDESNNTIFVYEKIHDYVSTKVNGTMASEMGLPYSVLGYIPWFNTYTSSAMGDEPEPEGGITDMLLWFYCLVNPILNAILHAQMAMTRGAFYQYLVNFAANVFMAVLTALGDLLWTIARAALIILFYIILAIEIATTIPLFLILGLTFSVFSLLIGSNCDWGVDFIVPYGSDTKIGFIDIDMSKNDKNLKFESWIKWIYWEFFDLYIPIPYMDFNTDVNEYFDDTPSDTPVQSGLGTFLTCGYTQLDEYIFDFETIYWDNPYNAPPEYVKLTLLSPSGIETNYTMKISPTGYKSIEYWVGKEDPRTGEIYTYDEENESLDPPNWYQGVRFNVTIDFEDDFTSNERTGQWYYQFIALADRDGAEQVKWPINEEYALGPYFNESDCVSMEHPIHYLQYEELNPYQGRSNEIFNFSVWWADYEENTLPEDVELILELPNNSILTYDMSNVSSYQIDYSIVSDYGNVTFIEYKCSLNLSEYIDDEIELFHYCYKAYLSNGNYTTLFDIQYVDEMGILIEDPDYLDGIEMETWFNGPQVYPIFNGSPIIKDWKIQDLTNNVELDHLGWLNPIWEESELVFWVYCADPDRSFDYQQEPNCYNETYPRVLLTNKKTNETVNLSGFKWNGYDYDIKADRYWVKIGADELGAGAWDFELIIKDNSSKIAELTKEDLPTIWIIGSASELFNTMRNSIGVFGYASTLTFMAFAGGFAASEVVGKVALGIATVGAAVGYIASIMAFIGDFCTDSNSGALLGLGWALITIFLTYSIGLEFSDASEIFKFEGILKGFSSIQVLDIIGSIFLTASLFTMSSNENQILSDLLLYTSDFFILTALTITMGIIVDAASFVTSKSTHNINPIRKVVQFFSYAIGILAVWSFLMASDVNGFFILDD